MRRRNTTTQDSVQSPKPARRVASGTAGRTALESTLALVDQALVSGTNFLTTVLVGRIAGLDELGAYSLGFAVVVVLGAIHEAIVAVPYTVYGHNFGDSERAAYAGSALVHAALLMVVAAAVLLTAAGLGFAPEGTGAVAWILAVVPLTLVREFARRYAFAHLELSAAATMDLGIAVLQLGAVAALAAADGLDAATALLTTAVAGSVVAGRWLHKRRARFRFVGDRLRADLNRNWRLGKWVGAARLTSVAHSYVVPWLVAFLLDLTATGGFAASMSVIAMTNPVLIGIGTLLTPTLARAYAEGGVADVRHLVARWTAWLTTGSAVVALPLAIFGGQILRLVYGPDYGAFHSTVAFLAGALVTGVVGMSADHGLRVIDRAQFSFAASTVGLAVTATLTLILVRDMGAAGGAIGLFAGTSTSAAIKATAFARHARRAGP